MDPKRKEKKTYPVNPRLAKQRKMDDLNQEKGPTHASASAGVDREGEKESSDASHLHSHFAKQ